MTIINLDYLAAECAQKIIQEGGNETLITKSLGVLQEQGVYALILFLLAQKDRKIRGPLQELLKVIPLTGIGNVREIPRVDQSAASILSFYSDKICQEFDTLFLVRDIYEQTLIYARYGAKAAVKSETGSSSTENTKS